MMERSLKPPRLNGMEPYLGVRGVWLGPVPGAMNYVERSLQEALAPMSNFARQPAGARFLSLRYGEPPWRKAVLPMR